MKTLRLTGLALLIALAGCREEAPTPQPYAQGVFVLNEGNFLSANASISYYNPEADTVALDVFAAANNRPLGDVLQSATRIGDRIFWVVNNSQKIEVTDGNLKSVGTVTGLTSPRYIAAVSDQKAYVTDLFSGNVSVLNTETLAITGTISIPGWTERVLVLGPDAFIVNSGRPYVYVVNTATDQVTDSIRTAAGTNSLTQDADGNLWVLCGGDYVTGEKGNLYRINPVTRTITLALPFSSGGYPGQLTTSPDKKILYYLDGGVFAMAISDATLPVTPFIGAGSASFYGMTVHPETGDLYVADAVDYTQAGRGLRYSASGSLLATFATGLIPNGFLFIE
ncbi:MAG: hypothetical protein SF053_19375 [Bacteroidia bacterium]|nr:hypothetical protein [Bacteroidia bacterium]